MQSSAGNHIGSEKVAQKEEKYKKVTIVLEDA